MQPRFKLDPDHGRSPTIPARAPRRSGAARPHQGSRAANGRGPSHDTRERCLDPFATPDFLGGSRSYEAAESLEDLHYRLEGRRLRISFLTRMGAPRSLIERERMDAERIDATIRLRVRAVQVRRNLDERLLLEEAVEAWEELADADLAASGAVADPVAHDATVGSRRGVPAAGDSSAGDLGPLDEVAFEAPVRDPGDGHVAAVARSGSSGKGFAKSPGAASLDSAPPRLHPTSAELEELLASDRLMGQVVTERIQALALNGVAERLATTA